MLQEMLVGAFDLSETRRVDCRLAEGDLFLLSLIICIILHHFQQLIPPFLKSLAKVFLLVDHCLALFFYSTYSVNYHPKSTPSFFLLNHITNCFPSIRFTVLIDNTVKIVVRSFCKSLDLPPTVIFEQMLESQVPQSSCRIKPILLNRIFVSIARTS